MSSSIRGSFPEELDLRRRAEDFVEFVIKTLLLTTKSRRDEMKLIADCRRLTQNLLVLQHIYCSGLVDGRSCTQRDIYYHLCRSFRDQSSLNRSLQDVCSIMQCSRGDLLVQAGARGFIGGRIVLDGVRLWELGQQGMSIDGRMASTTSGYRPVIDFGSCSTMLIIEKDAIFQQLMAQKLFNRLPCILITGMGFPAAAVRALVRYIADDASIRGVNLRVFGLVDYNPAGVHILLQYMAPTQKSSREGNFSVPQLKWLGLRGADVQTNQCGIFSERDDALGSALLGKHRHRIPPVWIPELSAMLQRRQKAEIEVLLSSSECLAHIVAHRIMRGDYI